MSITLPYRSDSGVPRPSATKRFPNGKIPSEHLVGCGLRTTAGRGGRELQLVEPAAQAMRAMVAAARADGVTITTSGTYRTYQQQVDMFTRKFSRTPRTGKSKTWDGQPWWPVPPYGVYSAATPGRSNHGKGLAADLARRSWRDNLGTKELRWLAANGPDFGFWNTVRQENFHWTYCLADDVTDRVARAVQRGEVPGAKKVDWPTVKALDEDLATVEYPGSFQRGAKGRAVMAVQWKLASFGYGIDVDGDFGSNTERAVRHYERANRLVADGVVDAVFWGILGLPGGGGSGGPIDGSPLPDPVPTTADASAAYVVQSGDGFERIARRTLWTGSKSAQRAIAEANDLTVESMIHPMQHLTIPGCRSTQVISGDTWDAVADRLSRAVDEVRSANGWQGDDLRARMVIYGGRAS